MLELASNTIKALGIFGRLSPNLEKYFDSIEVKYSKKPDTKLGYDIFRHHTLTFVHNATVMDIAKQLDLLQDLKQFLPYKLAVRKLFVKDEVTMPGAEHIAIEFGLDQTKSLLQFIRERVGDVVVETPYIKTIWFVPKESQEKVFNELKALKEIEFTDFYLISNKQNDENTIYTSTRFK
ncbi:MAG: hypothetical protein NUV65_05280 [Candidatus Roizmanbacteria bacterium]|nr:hypothetical protein [Candidatus Roizmanbacteria bacterium]